MNIRKIHFDLRQSHHFYTYIKSYFLDQLTSNLIYILVLFVILPAFIYILSEFLFILMEVYIVFISINILFLCLDLIYKFNMFYYKANSIITRNAVWIVRDLGIKILLSPSQSLSINAHNLAFFNHDTEENKIVFSLKGYNFGSYDPLFFHTSEEFYIINYDDKDREVFDTLKIKIETILEDKPKGSSLLKYPIAMIFLSVLVILLVLSILKS